MRIWSNYGAEGKIPNISDLYQFQTFEVQVI